MDGSDAPVSTDGEPKKRHVRRSYAQINADLVAQGLPPKYDLKNPTKRKRTTYVAPADDKAPANSNVRGGLPFKEAPPTKPYVSAKIEHKEALAKRDNRRNNGGQGPSAKERPIYNFDEYVVKIKKFGHAVDSKVLLGVFITQHKFRYNILKEVAKQPNQIIREIHLRDAVTTYACSFSEASPMAEFIKTSINQSFSKIDWRWMIFQLTELEIAYQHTYGDKHP